jgi:KaiC/GvpD/RAD55 family RecA-like ATPase
MLKNNMIGLNPFRVMGYESEDIIPEGGLGAVAAYAGVGKTALMVQMALNAMLRDKKVLHISLNDPVNKVTLWYREFFNNIAGQSGAEEVQETWDAILPNRFIMTFKVDGFNFPKLKERLTDLIVQNIFLPNIVILDGLKFDESERETIINLKAMAKKHAMRLWFTIHAHRHEETAYDEMPPRFLPLADLFDVVFKLQPDGGEIYIKSLKGKSAVPQHLFLDPATMLIKNR